MNQHVRTPRRFAAWTATFICLFVATGTAAANNHAPDDAITVCKEGCDYTTIQPALDAAPSGGVVSVGPGVYVGGITITKSVTLIAANAKRTVISGGGTSTTVVDVISGSVDIRGFTISGATGLGISTLYAPVVVRDSVITGNGSGAGGFTGALSFYDSVITRNTGAGIAGLFSGGIHVEDTIVSENGAGIIGDARVNVVVDDSRIIDNRGTGITARGSLTTFRTLISGNRATNGGGVYVGVGRFTGSAELVETTITGNTAIAKGGGIFIEYMAQARLRDSRVFRNTAASGGGVYNSGTASWMGPNNFFSVGSRIWNNTPDDYVAACDPALTDCITS